MRHLDVYRFICIQGSMYGMHIHNALSFCTFWEIWNFLWAKTASRESNYSERTLKNLLGDSHYTPSCCCRSTRWALGQRLTYGNCLIFQPLQIPSPHLSMYIQFNCSRSGNMTSSGSYILIDHSKIWQKYAVCS